MCSGDIFLALLAVLFPPIAVWIKSGICTADSLINILLCTLGYIPGLLHAWYIISIHPEEAEYEDEGDTGINRHQGHYYIAVPDSETGLLPAQQDSQSRREPHHQHLAQSGYGTVSESRTLEGSSASQGVPQTQQVGVHGSEEGVPPSYEQAIKGDHKVQDA